MKNKIIELIESLKFNGMAMALDSQIALAENGTSAPEIICNLLQEELKLSPGTQHAEPLAERKNAMGMDTQFLSL